MPCLTTPACPPETRRRNQAAFLRDDQVIMVATIAFGMGIDKPDVRFVAHLDLPKSVEGYYQETGRAGRDGLPANAWLAYGLSDMVTLRHFIETSEAEERFKRVEHHRLNAMLGFCETTTCRRQVLLNYFGEEQARPCGNCDTCLEPVQSWDGTQAARKALSCIFRTGMRFGTNYLIEVLLGKENPRIKSFGHDRVSTFGIGQELSVDEWKSVYRQLVAAGLVTVDLAGHGALQLTEQSRPVLRGEREVRLRRDPSPKRRGGARQDRDRAGDRAGFGGDPEAKALWERLRALRLELAQRQNLPPYVIFGDVTLRDLVQYRPRQSGRDEPDQWRRGHQAGTLWPGLSCRPSGPCRRARLSRWLAAPDQVTTITTTNPKCRGRPTKRHGASDLGSLPFRSDPGGDRQPARPKALFHPNSPGPWYRGRRTALGRGGDPEAGGIKSHRGCLRGLASAFPLHPGAHRQHL